MRTQKFRRGVMPRAGGPGGALAVRRLDGRSALTGQLKGSLRRTASVFALGASLVGTLAGLPAWAQSPAGQPMRFGPEKDYAPFVFQDAQGRNLGLSVDMLRLIEPHLGRPVQMLPARNLPDLLAMARAGQLELLSSLRPTPERGQYLAFSAPYVSVPAVLVSRAEGVGRVDDLSARRVAVGQGFAVESFLRDRHPLVQWVPVSDDGAGWSALAAGQVDALVADAASVRYLAQSQPNPAARVVGPVGFEYALSFAWPRERTDVGQAVEAAMRRVSPDARRAVLQRWVGDSDGQRSPTTQPPGWALGWALGGGVLALVLSAIGVVLLRRNRPAASRRDAA